jgi:hypothetical protein
MNQVDIGLLSLSMITAGNKVDHEGWKDVWSEHLHWSASPLKRVRVTLQSASHLATLRVPKIDCKTYSLLREHL